MKSLVLTLLSTFLLTNVVANELSWVDEQIQAIKPSRVGMKKSDLNSIHNPFIFFSAMVKKEEVHTLEKKSVASKNSINSDLIITQVKKKPFKAFRVSMIFNNKAMINGQWYKKGDSIHNYTVSHIDRVSVILYNQMNTILLSTRSKNKKLKFQK